jgi:hypothetical protein
MLREYEQVKVIKLEEENREHDGTDGVKRAPLVGDTGIIVHITTDSNTENNIYTVENINADGYTIWLADFVESEINLYAGEDSNNKINSVLTEKSDNKSNVNNNSDKRTTSNTVQKSKPQRSQSQYRDFPVPKEPDLIVYLTGVFLAGITSTAMCSYWLDITPIWLALLLGGLFGLIGVFMLANIGEAIVLSVIITFVLVVLFKSLSGLIVVKMLMVPVFIGYCVGQLVSGVWKELQ